MFRSIPRRRAASTYRPPFESLESRELLSASDLGLKEVKSTLQSGYVTGTAVKGTVTVQVTNQSAEKVSGPETFTVYGTATDGSTIALGALTKKNLKIGTANPQTKVAIPIKTNITTASDYQLYIQASDGVTVSQPSPVFSTVQVDDANVNLQATDLTVTGKSPNYLVNHVVTFKVTFVNTGNINTTSPLSAVLALSSDGTNALSPVLTATPQKKGVVIKDTGKPVTLTFSVKVPETGTFYIGGTFSTTDAGANSVVKFSTTQIQVLSKVN